MRMRLGFVTFLIGILLISGAAAAQNSSRVGDSGGRLHARDVAAALAKAGVASVEIKRDDEGDPQISAAHDGIKFSMQFYKCKKDFCGQVQFRSHFSGEQGQISKYLRHARKWNQQWVFGKAYVTDDAKQVLELAMHTFGGITEKNLQNYAELWLSILDDYVKHIEFRK